MSQTASYFSEPNVLLCDRTVNLQGSLLERLCPDASTLLQWLDGCDSLNCCPVPDVGGDNWASIKPSQNPKLLCTCERRKLNYALQVRTGFLKEVGAAGSPA